MTMNLDEKEIESFRSLVKGRVLLLCHHNAAPDSLCAAYATKLLVERMDPQNEGVIVLPGGASRLSKRVIGKLGIEASTEASLEDTGVFIALDTATISQLEDWGDVVSSSRIPTILIDHHTLHESLSKISSLHIVDEAATSTCEIVYGLYETLDIPVSPKAARALLVGMAFDSRHFSIGTARTLDVASRLIEIDGPLNEVFAMLQGEVVRSERIARLKAAQRTKLHDIGGWVVATSTLSSFHASAARALISLGAEVAIVCGKENEKIRASLRSTDHFYDETSIHLGEISRALGESFSGEGSGHPTAAGFNGEGDLQLFLQTVVGLIKEMIALGDNGN